MGWAKLDDQFTDHPKVQAVGALAELLAMRAIIYCARYETDGHIRESVLPRLTIGISQPKRHVAALVREGLWETAEDGWLVHDFLDYHPSKAERDAERAIARRRWALNNTPELREAIRDRDGSTCRYCGATVNWRDRKSPSGGTYDHVIPISLGGQETLDNIVVSCRRCNTTKAARTLEQAGMKLRPPRTSGRNQTGTKQENLDIGQIGQDNPTLPDLEEPLPTVGHSRPPDKLFEALVEACTGKPYETGMKLTGRERGMFNQAAGQLREVDATPEQVLVRANHWLGWVGQRPVPANLLAHWNRLESPRQRASEAEIVRLTDAMSQADRRRRAEELDAQVTKAIPR